jgi:hypothetical protein
MSSLSIDDICANSNGSIGIGEEKPINDGISTSNSNLAIYNINNGGAAAAVGGGGGSNRVGGGGEVITTMRVIRMPGRWHDWTLVCGNTLFECHRSVIGRHSLYLEPLIESAIRDNDNRIELKCDPLFVGKFEVSEHELHHYLDMVYTPTDKRIFEDHARDVAHAAFYLANDYILALCDDYLTSLLKALPQTRSITADKWMTKVIYHSTILPPIHYSFIHPPYWSTIHSH